MIVSKGWIVCCDRSRCKWSASIKVHLRMTKKTEDPLTDGAANRGHERGTDGGA